MYVTDGNLNLISADQLQVGDIVRDSGATFLITSIRKHEEIVSHASGLAVYSCKTRTLAAGTFHGPKHWLQDWTLQGNRLRSFNVINRT